MCHIYSFCLLCEGWKTKVKFLVTILSIKNDSGSLKCSNWIWEVFVWAKKGLPSRVLFNLLLEDDGAWLHLLVLTQHFTASVCLCVCVSGKTTWIQLSIKWWKMTIVFFLKSCIYFDVSWLAVGVFQCQCWPLLQKFMLSGLPAADITRTFVLLLPHITLTL